MTLCAVALAGCGGRSQDSAEADTLHENSLQDATGRVVRYDKTIRRIVSLAPNLTEILFALGADDRIVGRTTYCNYPPEAKAVTVVSDMQTPNYEQILSLHPELILMTFAGNSVSAYNKFVELRLEPFAVAAESVVGTLAAIDTIGMLIDRRDAARSLTQSIRSTIDSIRTLAASRPRVTTFIVLDRSPLMTVSGGFVNEALSIAGGENIAAGDVAAYPRYSREEVLRRDPDVIIVPGDSSLPLSSLLASFPEWVRLRAVRNRRVYTLPPDVLFRPGPRLAESVRLLYSTLHAEAPKSK